MKMSIIWNNDAYQVRVEGHKATPIASRDIDTLLQWIEILYVNKIRAIENQLAEIEFKREKEALHLNLNLSTDENLELASLLEDLESS